MLFGGSLGRNSLNSKNRFGRPNRFVPECSERHGYKNEYHSANGYSNYNMTYGQFMKDVYISTYETDVEETTYEARVPVLEKIVDRFSAIPLRSITLEDVQRFRIWLLSKKGAGLFAHMPSLKLHLIVMTLKY